MNTINDKMRDEFKPKETLENLINYWWVIIAFMLLGAALGRIAHLFFPPIYETHAAMGVSIDYSRTGLLSDIEEDQIFGTVADVFSTDAVINNVVDIAQAENIKVNKDSLKKIVIHERTDNTWLFRSQHSDPVVAARLANIWVEEAYNALDEAYIHTLMADGYQRYLDSLTSCLESIVIYQPAHSICDKQNLNEIQVELEKTSLLIQQEQQESLGIIPGVSFRIDNYAEIPKSSIRYNLNLLVVSGSLIGLMIGLWLINLPLLHGFRKKAHND